MLNYYHLKQKNKMGQLHSNLISIVDQGDGASIVYTNKDGSTKKILFNYDGIKSDTLSTDTISEKTSATGVTIDSVKLKDGGIVITSPTATVGVNITGVTGTGVYINKTANTAGTLKIHCHQMAASTDDSPNQYANEFKGEFLATSGTMDGIASHFQMAGSGSGVLRSVIGVAYLNSGITLSGTSATGSWISGGLFACSLASSSVLNGTAVIAAGLYAEISSAIDSTLTAVNHTAALIGYSKLLTKPSAGECSLLLLGQAAGATTVNQAIYLLGGATIDSFVTFDAATSGKCIETLAKKIDNTNTTHAIHIKIGAADGYIPVWAAKWNT
jgi:hypothetical protein